MLTIIKTNHDDLELSRQYFFVLKESSDFDACSINSNALQTTFDHGNKYHVPEAHTVCNIGFQSVGADKRADDKSRDWRENGKTGQFT